jgi:hypothetical protein
MSYDLGHGGAPVSSHLHLLEPASFISVVQPERHTPMEDVDDLEDLDRQIASAEDLISRQQRLVERLHGRGESTTHAEKLLATLRAALRRFSAFATSVKFVQNLAR